MKLRIACLQFSPAIGKVEQNIAKIKRLVTECPKEIDLLVLPELSITGYNFHTPQDLAPYLEVQGQGRSFQVAQELSGTLKCTTVIGYPEISHGTTYNSAMVVDPVGALVAHYRKTHMYEADEGFGCLENPDASFAPATLAFSGQNVRTNLGICMDLNPKAFKAPFGKFEFALSTWHHDSSLIIVPTAWLLSDLPYVQDNVSASGKHQLTALYSDFVARSQGDRTQRGPKADAEWLAMFEESDFVTHSQTRSKRLVDYWICRFFPYLAHPNNMLPKKSHKTTVVLCNRSGMEDDVVYGGLSCILQFDPSSPGNDSVGMDNPSVQVLASAGQVTEEVIYHEVEL